AAINRFKTVVTQYQDTRLVEEALERLTEANLAMGLVGEAQTGAAVLGHNFPDSRWYKDAYNLLKKKGAVPTDNGGAVSDAFPQKTGQKRPHTTRHARPSLDPRHRPHRAARHRLSSRHDGADGRDGRRQID